MTMRAYKDLAHMLAVYNFLPDIQSNDPDVYRVMHRNDTCSEEQVAAKARAIKVWMLMYAAEHNVVMPTRVQYRLVSPEYYREDAMATLEKGGLESDVVRVATEIFMAQTGKTEV